MSKRAPVRRKTDQPKALVRDAIVDAQMYDLSLLILSGCRTQTEQQARMGISKEQYYKLVRDPRFLEVYQETHERIFGDLAKAMKDERLDSVQRIGLVNKRALTLLANTIDEINTRVVDGKTVITKAGEERQVAASSTDLMAGVQAVKVALDNDPEFTRMKNTSVKTNIEFKIDATEASTIDEALKEAGLGETIDAEIVDGKD